MRAQNSDSDPIFVNNFTCPSVGKTMHYAFTSIFLDACVQDQRRQFFPHGSNIYSSDIEFLVNGVSNLLIYLVAFPHASNIYYHICQMFSFWLMEFLVNGVSSLLSLDSIGHDQRRQLNKHVRTI